MDFLTLKTEINTDPLGRGYSGMTDAEVATSLNVIDRPSDRSTVSTGEILAAIEPTAFPVDGKKQAYLQTLLATDEIPLGSTNIRDALASIFSGELPTLNALAALQTELISRAMELGLRQVREGAVAHARTL